MRNLDTNTTFECTLPSPPSKKNKGVFEVVLGPASKFRNLVERKVLVGAAAINIYKIKKN